MRLATHGRNALSHDSVTASPDTTDRWRPGRQAVGTRLRDRSASVPW
ncbi:hypothetical protein SAMN05444921_13113 [Streptomyces wuyuanensis]|uniref:Uncharacterized protein n=1 Tax=Streptomyces wuyuanensis TaxID=1196353 RepID=A0A1H0CT57_9ACTN|nr:hypothetical protein SAMN05444921_13113 [Streptomyces wuyuanensis]